MEFNIKELAEEYLEICDCFCEGDSSVGILPCKFYVPSDIYNGKAKEGYCKLKKFLQK